MKNNKLKDVPDEGERFEINKKIKLLAKKSWSNYIQNKKIFKNLWTEYAG